MEPRYTIENILRDLNETGHDWTEMPGLYFLSAASPGTAARINIMQTGAALKGFINNATGETKFYLAKWLNVPEREMLQ